MPQMTPEEVKEARATLGMTQKQLAEALDLSSTNSAETVRSWEAGRRACQGPEGVAIRLLVALHKLKPVKKAKAKRASKEVAPGAAKPPFKSPRRKGA